MNNKEKRIAVIKDVLKSLSTLKVAKGSYCEGQCEINNPQEDVDILKSNCQVCALGSLFLSHIGLYNGVDKYEIQFDFYDGPCINPDRNDICNHLEKYFSLNQLDMIEFAFEGYDLAGFSRKIKDACISYSKKYPNSTDRLRAILENMLENDGYFKPEIVR